jgi:hypothetical protein
VVTPLRDRISGPASAAVTATARGSVNPALPRPGVRAVRGHRLRVSWRAAAHATRYQVLVRPAGGRWRLLGWASGSVLTSRPLAGGRSYAVAVVAWDSYVAGRRSAIARVRVR